MTRPPPFRMTSTPPSRRPSMAAGMIRLSWHVSTASCGTVRQCHTAAVQPHPPKPHTLTNTHMADFRTVPSSIGSLGRYARVSSPFLVDYCQGQMHAFP